MRSPAAAGHVRSSSGGMGYRKQCPTCRRAFTHPPAFTIHRKSCGDEKSGGASPRGRVAAMSPRARPANPLSVPPKPPPATKRQRQLAAREELSISLEMVQAAYAADLEALTPKPPPPQGPTLMDLDAHDDDADAEMARQLQREADADMMQRDEAMAQQEATSRRVPLSVDDHAVGRSWGGDGWSSSISCTAQPCSHTPPSVHGY